MTNTDDMSNAVNTFITRFIGDTMALKNQWKILSSNSDVRFISMAAESDSYLLSLSYAPRDLSFGIGHWLFCGKYNEHARYELTEEQALDLSRAIKFNICSKYDEITLLRNFYSIVTKNRVEYHA
jgi:hypothetical protein